MAITSANHNAIPVAYFASGSFKDIGTVKKSIINLGFVPRYFKIFDETGLKTLEVFDGETGVGGTGGAALNEVTAGDKTLLTNTGPVLVRDFDSGAVGTWTVYGNAVGVVGTTSVGLPYTDAAEAADNSRLNLANEKFTGVTIPAALIASSSQARWIAFA